MYSKRGVPCLGTSASSPAARIEFFLNDSARNIFSNIDEAYSNHFGANLTLSRYGP